MASMRSKVMIARVRELQNQNEKAASGGGGDFAMWSGMRRAESLWKSLASDSEAWTTPRDPHEVHRGVGGQDFGASSCRRTTLMLQTQLTRKSLKKERRVQSAFFL